VLVVNNVNNKPFFNVEDKKHDEGDVEMDDDFLDMVTRSNIPQPQISEKQLSSSHNEIEDKQKGQDELKDGTR
jgi:hypothetical protein